MKSLIECKYDVIVIGGGPAGLAAAISSSDSGAHTLVIEREARIGGILKQCIHDGFGLLALHEKLTGPEYAQRYIQEVKTRNIDIHTCTFVTEIKRVENGFHLFLVNAESGIAEVETKAIVLATGCRERTAKQIFITGTRPAGIYTAGTAQYLVNMMGFLPCKKCVILGSGDIGLIMARRLTLEGAVVEGVYEAKAKPSGLARNIVQCLDDFEIPLALSHTVTRVFGEERVTAVEIAKVDEFMKPIAGTEHIVECDGIILSVGLIPENELAERLGAKLDAATNGSIVDKNLMTSIPGVFACGNSQHVFDLVDYVTESGTLAGISAAEFALCSCGTAIGVQQQNDTGLSSDMVKDDPVSFIEQQNMSYLTCIVCPRGCRLGVGQGSDDTVSGNLCDKGRVYALSEKHDPHRSVTSTVRTLYKTAPRLPVRTDGEVRKTMMMHVMQEINAIVLDHPVHMGEIIVENILNTGVNIIATSDLYQLLQME